jgi:hypothetical protein
MNLSNIDFKKLSIFFIKRIYAKGKINNKDLVYWLCDQIENAKTEKKKLSYGLTKIYGDDYSDQLFWGVSIIIFNHFENRIIEPILEQDTEYLKGKKEWFNNAGELIIAKSLDWDTFDLIEWRFTKGSRAKYLKNEINHEIDKQILDNPIYERVD